MPPKTDGRDILKRPAVTDEVYSADYFGCHAGGADWFERFMGTGAEEVYPIYSQLVKTFDPAPGERVLDIGCGRGEVAGLLAMKGIHAIGLDFSAAALRAASTLRDVFSGERGIFFHLVRADAGAIPFATCCFDHIVLSDIVEHLHDWQLNELYAECWRVLRPHGSLTVHTWPNSWHTKYTYPLVARISNFLGIPRPLKHRKPHDEIMHVNEQSLWSLRHGLRKANFVIRRSWCEHTISFTWSATSFAYWFSHRIPGLRLFFADHLWVLAMKDDQS